MKKNTKTYVYPIVRVDKLIMERSLLTVSVNVPGTTVEDAEEEEWIVS